MARNALKHKIIACNTFFKGKLQHKLIYADGKNILKKSSKIWTEHKIHLENPVGKIANVDKAVSYNFAPDTGKGECSASKTLLIEQTS